MLKQEVCMRTDTVFLLYGTIPHLHIVCELENSTVVIDNILEAIMVDL